MGKSLSQKFISDSQKNNSQSSVENSLLFSSQAVLGSCENENQDKKISFSLKSNYFVLYYLQELLYDQIKCLSKYFYINNKLPLQLGRNLFKSLLELFEINGWSEKYNSAISIKERKKKILCIFNISCL